MTDGPDSPPEWIAGRFRLTELLGTGGSASVFRADDAATGETVAVKILHPHLTDRDAARAFFLAEATRAREVQHPHIVRIVDVGIDTSASTPVVWIAAEYVPGRTLAEHVRERGPLAPTDAARVADAVLGALAHAHQRGLVHRDVTPSNIMFATDERGRVDAASVRLLDFGIADRVGEAAVGERGLLGEDDGRFGVIGNAHYLSPEQARGEPIDERGDVYQVGAVLYFALVGRAPFVRASSSEVAAAHVSAPPPVPSAARAGLAREFDRIVVRAMLKSPDDRFAGAAAMRDALREALAGGMPDPVPASAAVVTEQHPAVASERTGVTRVLGATLATGRMPERSGGFGTSPLPAARRGGGVVALVLGITLLVGIGVAVASSPTASVRAEATSTATPPTPTPTPTPTASVDTVETVAVPELVGLTRPGAQQQLTDASFVLGEVLVADSASAVDVVLSSDPGAGTRVRPGIAVTLTVASGFNTIPAVVGLDAAAAEEALRSAGFVPSLSTPAAGAIVSRIEPAAGTRWTVGTSILVIASVPQPTPTPQPTIPTPTPQPTAPTPTATPTGAP